MALLTRIAWRQLQRLYRAQAGLSIRTCSTESQEISHPATAPTQQAMFSAINNLKMMKSPFDVLVTVQHHLPAMNHTHLMEAFRTIFQLYKVQKVDENVQKIIHDPGFQVFCETLKRRAGALDTYEAVEALKILTFLNVPVNSSITQTILQMIRGHLNNLNLRQIMFVHFLLTRHDCENHLVDALKLALPFVFQIHLPLELDTDDFELLKDMLMYSCHSKLPDRCINNIITGILLHEDFSVEDSKLFLWALCEINCDEEIHPTRTQLLRKCFNNLASRIDEMKFEDVLRTVAKMKSRVVDKHPEFYNEKFSDASADYVIKNGLEFEEGLLIGRVLSRIGHTHIRLMEYLCSVALTNRDILANARTNTLFSFITCLANNNYTPDAKEWEQIQTIIDENPVLEVQSIALPWSKACLELASLGYYNEKLIKKIFSEEFLQEYLSRDNNKMDHIQLLTIQEAIKVFRPQIECRLPDEVTVRAKEMYPIHQISTNLVEHLAYGLGGHGYIAQNVELPSGIVLDLLMCLRNGYAVPLNATGSQDTKTPLEEIRISEYTLPIALMAFHRGCFSLNSNRLRGTFRLLNDIIEKNGILVVPINVQEWLNLNTVEKSPYLVRELGHKCSEVGMNVYNPMDYSK